MWNFQSIVFKWKQHSEEFQISRVSNIRELSKEIKEKWEIYSHKSLIP